MHLMSPLIIRKELQAFLAEWRRGDQLENAERLRLKLEARLVLRMLLFVFCIVRNGEHVCLDRFICPLKILLFISPPPPLSRSRHGLINRCCNMYVRTASQ